MKVVGLIAEFNPFHNGHAQLIEKIRDPMGPIKATHIVTVMSGNFVQRGEPALLSKQERVKTAINNGIDLVIELPIPWSIQSAEGFAKGSIHLLNALGNIDVIVFGSECGNTELLNKAADIFFTKKFKDTLHYHLSGGISYAEAQEKALNECSNSEISSLLKYPNNTLAIEYIKALKEIKSNIEFYTIKRTGSSHDSEIPNGTIASASYIRNKIKNNQYGNIINYLPKATQEIINTAISNHLCPSKEETIERVLLYKLRSMQIEDFKKLPAISEGLENRFYNAAQNATTMQEFYEMCKTKRYPMTRLQRIVYSAYLELNKDDIKDLPPYIRPLGCTENGMEIIRNAQKNNCTLPIISRISKIDSLDERSKHIWNIENRACDLYELTLPKPNPCGQEYKTKIYKLNTL